MLTGIPGKVLGAVRTPLASNRHVYRHHADAATVTELRAQLCSPDSKPNAATECGLYPTKPPERWRELFELSMQHSCLVTSCCKAQHYGYFRLQIEQQPQAAFSLSPELNSAIHLFFASPSLSPGRVV